MKIKFLSLILFALIMSCKSQKVSYENSESLNSGNYAVTALGDEDISNKNLSLNIDLTKDIISGYSGCNNFTAELTTEENSLKTGDAGVTMRYCDGDMDLERKFLGNLRKIDSYKLENGVLTLIGKDGETLIKANQMQTELKSGNYKVLTVDGKDVTKEELSINIDTDNKRFAGNTGCNTFGSEYELNGNTVEMGMARVTKMYCEGKMKLENSFLKNLKNIHSFEYDGDQLQLKSEEGEVIILAEQTN